jgi:hypothetical protein
MCSKVERMNNLLRRQRCLLEADLEHDLKLVAFLEQSARLLSRRREKELMINTSADRYHTEQFSSANSHVYYNHASDDEESLAARQKSASRKLVYG